MTTFTRRHWGREALAVLLFPISMLTSKPPALPNGRLPRRELSMQRVILAVFVVQFARSFPAAWTMPDVAALAVLTFALVIEALFALVPVREGLAALVAIFGGAVAKRTRTTVVEEQTETPPSAAAVLEPDAPDAPHEWADGSDEGDL